jgi:hypothetical protein
MVRRWIARYFWVVQLALLLIGVLLVFVSTIFTSGSRVSLGTFSVGVALISTTVLTLLNNIFGTDIPSVIEQRLGFDRRIYDMGLEMIHIRAGDETVFEKFDYAHSIDIMYNTAKNPLHRYKSRIANAIINRNCRVRIIITDPNNLVLKNGAISDALCPGTDIVGELRDVTNYLRLMVAELKNRNPPLKGGSIEVRVQPALPTGSIVIVNGDIARYTPYLPYLHSTEAPVFDVTRERGGHLFNQYENTFNRVWGKSTVLINEIFL